MSEKVIRIWDGCRVVQVVAVGKTGSSTLGSTGGAENATKVDIEIDPWAGLLVDHSAADSPFMFRDEGPGEGLDIE